MYNDNDNNEANHILHFSDGGCLIVFVVVLNVLLHFWTFKGCINKFLLALIAICS